MMANAQQEIFNVVIVSACDRLVLSVTHFLQLLEEFGLTRYLAFATGAVYSRRSVNAHGVWQTTFLRYSERMASLQFYHLYAFGAVLEKTIMEHIESQKWEPDDQGIKITASPEP